MPKVLLTLMDKALIATEYIAFIPPCKSGNRDRQCAKDVVGNNSPFCTKELGCTARRKTRRATG